MSDRQNLLSKTQSGSLKACSGCVELNELRHFLSNLSNDFSEAGDRVEALTERVSQHDIALATLTERVLQSVDGLRREFAAAVRVASLERQGIDVHNSTPPAQSSLTLPGGVKWRAPTWASTLVVLVVLGAVLLGGGAAAGAYVTARWGGAAKVSPLTLPVTK